MSSRLVGWWLVGEEKKRCGDDQIELSALGNPGRFWSNVTKRRSLTGAVANLANRASLHHEISMIA